LKIWTNPQIKIHKRSKNSDWSDHRHNAEIKRRVFKMLNTTDAIFGEYCDTAWV